MKLIKDYVDITDPKAAATSRAGLIAKCNRVLKGKADRQTKKRAVRVIHWQQERDSMVHSILGRLIAQRLFMECFEPEFVENQIEEFDDHSRELMDTIHCRLWQISSARHLLQHSWSKVYCLVSGSLRLPSWKPGPQLSPLEIDLEAVAAFTQRFLEEPVSEANDA